MHFAPSLNTHKTAAMLACLPLAVAWVGTA